MPDCAGVDTPKSKVEDALVFPSLTVSNFAMMISWRAFTFALLAGGLLLCSGCRRDSDKTADQSELARPVIYHEVSAAGGGSVRSFPALITASDRRELTFPRPGVVEAVLVEESDRVTAGQTLARLDDRDYASGLSAARAKLENAEQALQRAQTLFAEDAIARNVLEQREAAEQVARAEFDAAEKALAEAHIEAPFAGVVSRVLVRESQAVAAGTPAVRIFSLSQLEATIAVPAALIIAADGSRRTELGATVRLEVGPGRPIEALFKSAALEADAGSQSYAVTFAFESPKGLNVLPGMNAEVELVIGGREASEQVTVPLRAVGMVGDANFVWVVETGTEPHQVARRFVEVGPGIGERLPVSSGLEPGEVIVAAGVSSLAEGMAVRPWERTAD
ncbi:MAG: efflux RND transporter periplasmic adaptor subunit [Verrucomicrobia bacterium]|nr:efflux RND transporter periplasmic adaptor subunit [Verrucomicrobiota bacterium]